MLEEEFNTDIQLKSLEYMDEKGIWHNRYGRYIQGNKYIELSPDALVDRGLARSVTSHEMVHFNDYATPIKDLPKFTQLPGMMKQYTEKNAYLNMLQNANKFHLSGRHFSLFHKNFNYYNDFGDMSQYYSYQGKVPKYSIVQLWNNMF